MSSSKDHPDPPPTPVTPGKRRRQKNSSDEESYAGPVEAELVPTPVLPVSMASPSTVPLQRKRTRRTHGYLDEAIPTSMSQDDIRDEPLRVGGPNLSRLPVRNVHISAHHPIHQVWDDWLETAVHQILRQHEIEWRSVSLIRRPSRYDPRPESDMAITITVFADRKEANDRWLDACLVIRRLLRQSDHADLLVEIADPEIAKPTMTSPIGPNDRLVSIWPQIEPQIADILRPTECVQLQVLRRGKHLNPAANPVTVVMTIPEESRGDWTEVRERIIDVLDQHRLDDVAVEIGRGTIWRASSLEQRLLPDDAWETPAKGGLSLGLFRSSASSLTLGGFVEVQDKGGEWSRLGLTCYHGVFPMHSQDGVPCEKITLMEWHRTGVRPESPGADQIRVSQPSLKDHEQTVNEYRRQIETLRDERFLDIERRFEDNGFIMPFELKFLNVNKAAIKRLQDRINHADEFFRAAKDDLGPVWAGSGTRRSDQLATLDWALIKVKPDRLSINHVPQPEEFPQKTRELYNPVYTVVDRAPDSSPSDPYLFKVGRSTGGTCGLYNAIKATEFGNWADQDHDGEPRKIPGHDHAVAGMFGHDNFSRPGDSGSFVLDRTGRMVGMLMGGNDHTNTSFFTSVTELFADIRRITSAIDVRLPPE